MSDINEKSNFVFEFQPVTKLFEEQVRLHPDKCAVASSKESDSFYSDIADGAVSANENTSEEDIGISVNFDELLGVNDRVAGWLYSKDTVINYPVVYPTDNSYYLTHLMDGERNKNGTLFIDSRNAEPFTDTNTIIYGHHMKSGKMFASLVEYGEQSYYDEHPYMYYLSPNGNYRLDIISSFVTESTSFAYQRSFESEADYAAFLEKIKAASDTWSRPWHGSRRADPACDVAPSSTRSRR